MNSRPCLINLIAIVTFLTLLASTASTAHEFWIEPQKYQVASGAPLVANLRNGQNFSGAPLAYFPRRFQRFELIHNAQTAVAEGRMGDVPALQLVAPDDGLLVIVHQTTPKTLRYDSWEKFAAFVAHKGFSGIAARHQARGLPDKGFHETYTRFAKALVGVGTGQGRDAPTGMETEFVALTNPYTDDPARGMTVLVLYQGRPRADTQIEVFARSPDGMVKVSLQRTDAHGKATIATLAGHSYLLDAVVLRQAPDGDKAVWVSLWAALSFAVPR